MLEYENFSANGALLRMYEDCYFIHFEYESRENAQDFFQKVATYIKAFDDFTNQLAKPFGIGIEINLEIQTLENGSLRLWLKDILEKIDDKMIRYYAKNPKEAIIDLVILARRRLLKALQEKRDSEILTIYQQTLENSSISKEIGYKIDEKSFLESVCAFSKKAMDFKNPPTIHIQNELYTMQSIFTYDFKEFCEKQKMTTFGSFLIKKPDLQGDSQWEVIADRVIKVKITDESFLKSLKNREVLIGYGDRLQATLETIITTYNGEIKEVSYTIPHIKRLIPKEQEQELFLH